MKKVKHKSIWVSEEVWKKLINIKYRYGFRNLDEVIRKLLEVSENLLKYEGDEYE
jgi:hypothetical protein